MSKLADKAFICRKNSSIAEPRIEWDCISTQSGNFYPLYRPHPHLQYRLPNVGCLTRSQLPLSELILIMLAAACSLALQLISSHWRSVKLFFRNQRMSSSILALDLTIYFKLLMNFMSVSMWIFYYFTVVVFMLSFFLYFSTLKFYRTCTEVLRPLFRFGGFFKSGSTFCILDGKLYLNAIGLLLLEFIRTLAYQK